MITRIEIFNPFDARAVILKEKLQNLFTKKIFHLWLIEVYTLDKTFTFSQLEKIANALSHPLLQKCFINSSINNFPFTWAIEIGFLPGVTDNVATTTKEIIEDLLKVKFSLNEGVYTSQLLLINSQLSKNEVIMISKILINPLVQRVHFKKASQFKKDGGMDKIIPKVKIKEFASVTEVNLNVSDTELKKIGKEGIINNDGSRRGPLALDLIYMKAIKKYFNNLGRNPTDIELESIAQTWSEHCKHAIFADPIDKIKDGLFKTYIKKATERIRKKKGKKDFCYSVFTDNSGAIEFDKNYLITHKVETHNSPSALDPFAGAMTGIVGVNRDAIGFGLGAKPIVNTFGFCFANPKKKPELYRDINLYQKILPPKRIMEGVIEGVKVGGNCSGIPTPQGFVYFNDCYLGKPLVFVGTVGLIPKKNGKRKLYYKKAQPGDYIVMVGGRVGLDGIHGATFSSEALSSGSPTSAVQIGDPITQKKLSDALIKEARDLNLYNSITDNGAGGLSCSVGEMAKESGGCQVDLEKVPLKYPNLSPWQVWISESQERMTLAVPPKKWPQFSSLMKRRGIEATIIGKFTNSGRCLVKYYGQKIMDVDLYFLHYGLPKKLKTTSPPKIKLKEPVLELPSDFNQLLLTMLSQLNLTSFEFVSSQYDHEVQGSSVIKPLQGKGRINGETTVIRPLFSSKKGIALSQGIYPSYSLINCYWMSACCIDTAVRNLVVVGANPEKIALLDNFCWCSSDESEKLYQLKQAVKGCYDFALAYQTPFISGKDSMFNDFKGYDKNGRPTKISILPTLLISSLGIIENIYQSISIDIKFPGDLVYILGETKDELGGSEYYALFNKIGTSIPKPDPLKNKKLYQTFYQCLKKNLIASAISVTRGGLAIALSKMTIAGKLGVKIFLKNLPGKTSRDDFALFSESQGRIIVTINPKNKKLFEKIMIKVPFSQIGVVTEEERLIIEGKEGKKIVDLNLASLLKSYKKRFKNY